MKKVIYFFAMICISQMSYSQSDFREGFIINQNRDTTFGQVSYMEGNLNYKYCNFKGNDSHDIVMYKAEDIIGYGFKNDKYFESRQIETDLKGSEYVLLEVLIKGKVSLFKYYTVFYIENAESGLLKLSHETIESTIDGETRFSKSSKYLGVLNLLLSDCTEMSSRIPRTSFSERSLTDLIESYNKCMNSTAIIYKASKPWIHARFGIAGGLISSQIALKDKIGHFDHLGPFERSKSPLFGVSFEILLPRLNERWSLNTDVFFSKSNYDSYNEEILFYKTTKNYVTIEMTHLKIPLGFRYTLKGKSLSSYFNLGLSETFTLNSSSAWTQEVKQATLFDTYHKEALEISKTQLGMWGGAGISKSIIKGLKIYLELRCEMTDGINAANYIAVTKSNVTTVQFIIGIATE